MSGMWICPGILTGSGFSDTEMEWDFVPDQIIPYQLQIEYVGHYGIEDNEFDLYQVTKGAAPEAGEP